MQVFLRVRPEVAKEKKSGAAAFIFNAQHVPTSDSYTVTDPTSTKKTHKGFKAAFMTPECQNQDLYHECLMNGDASAMRSVTEKGKTACVFAYGHTGSGKTYTIFGSPSIPGIYRFAAQDLCTRAKAASTGDANVFVAVRFVQLYQGKCQDLLTVGAGSPGAEQAGGKRTFGTTPLTEMQVREDAEGRMMIRAPTHKDERGLWRQPGLETVLCRTEEEVCGAVVRGLKNRQVGSSGVHDESSRSHVFLEMELMSDELAAAQAELLDLEAAVYPLGHAAAGEEFRREDVIKAKFEELYNKGSAGTGTSADIVTIGRLRVDISAGDSGHERGAAKNIAKDEAYIKFKKDVTSLSVEERMQFDPLGWESARMGESVLAVLERAVDVAEAEVRAQQAKVEAVRAKSAACVGGTLVLVDLAGNEASVASNVARPTPDQRKQIGEQKEINKSLFALKECIRGLHARGKTTPGGRAQPRAAAAKPAAADHIAFRRSRLTMILKQHLVGGAHAVMIATASPSSQHAARTSDTLAYAALVASAA